MNQEEQTKYPEVEAIITFKGSNTERVLTLVGKYRTKERRILKKFMKDCKRLNKEERR